MGKPLATREVRFHQGQSGEVLIQKLAALVIADEEQKNLTISVIANRARKAFNVDTVIKNFYDSFKKEHQAFLEEISNIKSEEVDTYFKSPLCSSVAAR